jgi:hypothetical protein
MRQGGAEATSARDPAGAALAAVTGPTAAGSRLSPGSAAQLEPSGRLHLERRVARAVRSEAQPGLEAGHRAPSPTPDDRVIDPGEASSLILEGDPRPTPRSPGDGTPGTVERLTGEPSPAVVPTPRMPPSPSAVAGQLLRLEVALRPALPGYTVRGIWRQNEGMWRPGRVVAYGNGRFAMELVPWSGRIEYQFELLDRNGDPVAHAGRSVDVRPAQRGGSMPGATPDLTTPVTGSMPPASSGPKAAPFRVTASEPTYEPNTGF